MTVKRVRMILLSVAVLLAITLILFSGYAETHVACQPMMRRMLILYCVGMPAVSTAIISVARRREKT